MRSTPLVWAVVVGCSLAAPGPVRSDYADSFKRGIKAVDFRQWEEAEALMRLAIAHQPPDAPGKALRIYGTRFEAYLPYYYLGLAHFRQDDCRGALDAFEKALDAGAVIGIQRGKIRLWDDLCRQRLGVPRQPVRSRSATIPRQGGVSPSAPSVPGSSAPGSQSARTPAPRGQQHGRSRQPAGSGTSTGSGRPPSSSGAPPSAGATHPPGGGTTQSQAPPQTTAKVIKRQLAEAAADTEKALEEGEQLATKLDRRRRAGAAAFRRRPILGETLDAAKRLLQSARFLCDGGRAEQDLAAIQEARDDALAAVEELEVIERAVGR